MERVTVVVPNTVPYATVRIMTAHPFGFSASLDAGVTTITNAHATIGTTGNLNAKERKVVLPKAVKVSIA